MHSIAVCVHCFPSQCVTMANISDLVSFVVLRPHKEVDNLVKSLVYNLQADLILPFTDAAVFLESEKVIGCVKYSDNQ